MGDLIPLQFRVRVSQNVKYFPPVPGLAKRFQEVLSKHVVRFFSSEKPMVCLGSGSNDRNRSLLIEYALGAAIVNYFFESVRYSCCQHHSIIQK